MFFNTDLQWVVEYNLIEWLKSVSLHSQIILLYKLDENADEGSEMMWGVVVVGWELERSSHGGYCHYIIAHQSLFKRIFELLWVSNEELSNWLADDVPDWFVFTVALKEVKWHQSVDVVLQAFWFVNNDFSQGTQEHVFLMGLWGLNQLEHLDEEEVSVSNGYATKGNSGCLSDLIVWVLEEVGDGLNNVIDWGQIFKDSNFTKA